MNPGTSELPLVVVVGPTASGKSALGVWLAERFGGEVLACDSTQLYRGFDIGTAKPGDLRLISPVINMHSVKNHFLMHIMNALRGCTGAMSFP